MPETHQESKEPDAARPRGASLTVARSFTAFGVLFFLFGIGFAIMAGNLFALESQLVESIALHDAGAYTRALKEFRTLYTAEVVERVRPHGIEVTHDYKKRESAIPLPATLSILLGNRLGDESGTSVRLYSGHPFPWRVHEGGPSDAFEQTALQKLTADPDQPYFRFESLEGGTVLRYAIADRMRASCVDCHNNHAESPKTDWNVGDVRGVLSVVKPLAQSTVGVRKSLRVSIATMLGLAIFAMFILGMASVRHRRDARFAVQLAAETERANTLLARQIAERDRVENERRRLEKHMHQMQKLEQIGLLAGGIAHDFNNLLQSLLGNSELALGNVAPESKARPYLENAIDVASRASDLTNQLLIYAGKAPVIKHPLDLSALVAEMRPFLKTVTGGAVKIDVQLAAGPVPIEADPTQVKQIILNLVTNAFDAVQSPHGRVLLRTRMVNLDSEQLDGMTFGVECDPGPYVLLEVEDNGCGMDAELTQRIFDPFFSTKQSGRGLGLSLLGGIVLAHHGTLQVQTQVNQGTSFRVYLPKTSKLVVEAQTVSTVPAAPVDSSLSVLVVDDEEGIRTILTEFFKAKGFNVTGVESGEKALGYFDGTNQPFDLIILDIRMPGMSGLETFKALRERGASIQVLLSSGDLPDAETQELIRDGHLWFIHKPYTFSTLLSMIDELKSG